MSLCVAGGLGQGWPEESQSRCPSDSDLSELFHVSMYRWYAGCWEHKGECKQFSGGICRSCQGSSPSQM